MVCQELMTIVLSRKFNPPISIFASYTDCSKGHVYDPEIFSCPQVYASSRSEATDSNARFK